MVRSCTAQTVVVAQVRGTQQAARLLGWITQPPSSYDVYIRGEAVDVQRCIALG